MVSRDAFLTALTRQQKLSIEEMIEFWRQVDHGEQSPQKVLAVLSALSSRPLEVDIAVAFLRYLQLAYPKTALRTAQNAVNIVGTGGGISTFNISTTSAFVVAAAGVRVLKSGSRAYSSQTGSQDVLERLGIRVTVNDDILEEMLQTLGIGFAPIARYPALCRKLVTLCQPLPFSLVGQVINRLGPLLCPFELKGQVIGVSDPSLLQTLACTAREMGLDNLLFTHSQTGADEMLPFGGNSCWWVRFQGDLQWSEVANTVGSPPRKGDITRLKGGNAAENAQRLQRVLAGKDCDEAQEAVALNAGAALWVAGRVNSLQEGSSLAKEILRSGLGGEVLQRTQRFCRQLREVVV
ncbi:anthranilate phosphoribosyltransferase [Raoultella ornithinolytica]|uniref:anthranilate phosphoribosyltransferase n=1 Tax=Raoultella ornithinolytica TaxID=54291 RepID=UPI000698FAFD|nr:anthranilate phosphoribosyltransferase [Raoultella ornithinolytica]ALQ47396.1 Anthranilate phosphoribosyltransferase [Raoultella ornithinolytica]EKX4892937.1 anthranilate phosphoribosyltransferase [Raoultella ornithinolytica]ELT0603831.1 anthranilate phosphoribosyltransferase [Raoultella ornithinolytica]ELT0734986.1 anthranilate phosphoribosyltransferase [Raoultella ornithinolytica]MDS0887898.1 anthranilate phosphoribosyltransferase [Raoultella ornithinolytica]